ncbi:hypothetical protein JXM67_11250 [candidate division WOR-3 bacterium]|nr:hypothetical protein [candidate division WOR-3 bacterium]
MVKKPKVGFYSFSGCEGDLLTIIHCEDELLDIFGAVDVRSFRMASSERHDDESLDVAFVEGSITTKQQSEKIKKIRERSSVIVAIGSCACYGGPQSARLGYDDWEERFKKVYAGARLTIVKPQESQPLDEYIKVDYYIPGCPMDKHQFFYALTRLAKGMPVELSRFPVCAECKWNENECLLLKGQLCLGPVTAGGCNSRCPNYGLPCIGCWGPTDEANVASEINLLKERNFREQEIVNKLRLFGGSSMVKRFGELLGIKKTSHASSVKTISRSGKKPAASKSSTTGNK